MIEKLIRRFLTISARLGVIKKIHTIVYTGDIASTNDIYQSRHFGVRLSIERKFSKIFRTLFAVNKPPKVNEFGLIIFYNNKMDVCNLSFMQKMFVDSFKKEEKWVRIKNSEGEIIKKWKELVYKGFVDNDDQRYFKFMMICPDKKLPKETLEFNICVL